jgi:acyl carrier protein
VAEAVRGLVCRLEPSAAAALYDDLPLSRAPTGFDSLRLVELLLLCEEHFAVPFPAALLRGAPLTVQRLVDHVCTFLKIDDGDDGRGRAARRH